MKNKRFEYWLMIRPTAKFCAKTRSNFQNFSVISLNLGNVALDRFSSLLWTILFYSVNWNCRGSWIFRFVVFWVCLFSVFTSRNRITKNPSIEITGFRRSWKQIILLLGCDLPIRPVVFLFRALLRNSVSTFLCSFATVLSKKGHCEQFTFLLI